jgi:hypothetical protein
VELAAQGCVRLLRIAMMVLIAPLIRALRAYAITLWGQIAVQRLALLENFVNLTKAAWMSPFAPRTRYAFKNSGPIRARRISIAIWLHRFARIRSSTRTTTVNRLLFAVEWIATTTTTKPFQEPWRNATERITIAMG